MSRQISLRRQLRMFLRSAWAMVVLFLAMPNSAQADGGLPVLVERLGDYQVAVFVSPAPPRVGPVDISVLVQQTDTGEPVSPRSITVSLKSEGPYQIGLTETATTAAATNKLFRAAHFNLPSSGLWNVAVEIDSPAGMLTTAGQIAVSEPLPRWRQLWPWFAWPALPIVLFVLYQQSQGRRVPKKSSDPTQVAG